MTKTEPHAHQADELCEAGVDLYARALREGRVPYQDAVLAPCLMDLGLLRSDIDDAEWLRPASPTEAFEPLTALDTSHSSPPAAPAITVLDGLDRINAAIDKALTATTREALVVQPGGFRPPEALAVALPRDQALLSRGGRLRTLYQHTTRHALPVLAHYEQLDGDVEVRTLDEVTERLFIFDRTVAFIPASKDRSVALEVRHRALVQYLATTFERLWRLATPMYPDAAHQPAEHGITTRQRAIAGLLIEGLTDTQIAARLGMNVRTARVHIAKLATILGSESRAQLGYLIGRSGILTPDD